VDASVESVSVITGTTLGTLSGVTGADRISSVISGLTTGEAMDTPTEDTAVAAAIDTPLPPDIRTDSPIHHLCFPTV